jgi:hypothetical protein
VTGGYLPPPPAAAARIAAIVCRLFDYGQVEGQQHQRWVIDQTLRLACGTDDRYRACIDTWAQTYGVDWDPGVAP